MSRTSIFRERALLGIVYFAETSVSVHKSRSVLLASYVSGSWLQMPRNLASQNTSWYMQRCDKNDVFTEAGKSDKESWAELET